MQAYSVCNYITDVLKFPALYTVSTSREDGRIRAFEQVLRTMPAWGSPASVRLAITPELYGHAVWPEHIHGDSYDHDIRTRLLEHMLPSYAAALQAEEKPRFAETAVLFWLSRYPEDITPGWKELCNQTRRTDTLVYPEDVKEVPMDWDWVDGKDLRYSEEQVICRDKVIKSTLKVFHQSNLLRLRLTHDLLGSPVVDMYKAQLSEKIITLLSAGYALQRTHIRKMPTSTAWRSELVRALCLFDIHHFLLQDVLWTFAPVPKYITYASKAETDRDRVFYWQYPKAVGTPGFNPRVIQGMRAREAIEYKETPIPKPTAPLTNADARVKRVRGTDSAPTGVKRLRSGKGTVGDDNVHKSVVDNHRHLHFSAAGPRVTQYMPLQQTTTHHVHPVPSRLAEDATRQGNNEYIADETLYGLESFVTYAFDQSEDNNEEVVNLEAWEDPGHQEKPFLPR
ncbi:hypothetical protein BDP27DRAFT_1425413 [Rhodocollybia butyracea]|uniref:Uncharacterized protein n=1 Tax=Rhodocollybia butyracea TaxID=206335 RepID=A0A9P5PLP7_9AGAR|nr:hypothetical protein BDP27DRAFT_1425413 [Rhodocollybia butyracea]